MTFISYPPVSVAEPHDVVQIGGGSLEHVTIGYSLHLVHGTRRHVIGLACLQRDILQVPVSVCHTKDHRTGQQADCLVLAFVVLHRKRMSSLDMQNLANVPVGVGPDALMSPWLVNHHNLLSSAHAFLWFNEMHTFTTGRRTRM